MFGQIHYRLELFVQSKAPDGMDIDRYANFDWLDPKDAPSEKTSSPAFTSMIEETEALDKAPLVDPYAGPALLTGRAAAVFSTKFSAIAPKDSARRTSTKARRSPARSASRFCPISFRSRTIPPRRPSTARCCSATTRMTMRACRRRTCIWWINGVLKTFLMSRSPLVNIPHSNGHGRRQLGYAPIARQGNLIVSSTNTMTDAQLRAKLIELIKQQNKPFGLLIDDIAGGFTFTGRGKPQAFQVQPLVVYKVFPDGRPDELVRGVDIVGTPLVSLTKIVATGDTDGNFQWLLRRRIGLACRFPPSRPPC